MQTTTTWLLTMPMIAISITSAAFSMPVIADTIKPAIENDQDESTSIWDDLDISIGVSSSYEPDYQGSDDYEIDVLPVLQVIYKDWLYLDNLTAGAIWNLPYGFRLQTAIGTEEGRKASDNDDLDGLDDGKDTIVLDGGLFYDIGDLTLGFAFEQDLLGRGKSLVTFWGAQYRFEFLDDRLEITPGFDISFATGKHMRTEFGISDEEAANSQLDAYRPGAGLKSYGGEVDVEYKLTESWTIVGEAGIEFYGPEATKSPLLDDVGADYGAEVEIALTYTF